MNSGSGGGAYSAARSLALDVVAVEASAALNAAGIECVLLKGPAMAYWLYADRPAERTYTDVDLLVAPSEFAAAGATLAARGFHNPKAGLREREAARLEEESWVRDGPIHGSVDLHRGFHGVQEWSTFWEVIRGHAVSMPLLNSSVLIPDLAGIALIAALHASDPGPAGPTGRPARDLARACDRLDDGAWQAAADRAEAVGASERMAFGLRLDPQGRLLAERLGLPVELSPAEGIRALFIEQGKPDRDLRGGGARHLTALAAVGSWRERLILMVDVLAPSPVLLKGMEPVASRGVGGLALAYPRRLLRLTGRLPGALQIWLAGRARARRSGWEPIGAARPSRRWQTISRVLCLPGAPSATLWAVIAVWSARRQLQAGRLEDVRLPTPPRDRGAAQDRALHGVLRRLSASCLESALVRQAWLAGRGEPRDVVIGIRAPAEGFRAHAWLEGDSPDTAGFQELFRRHWSDGHGVG